MSLAASGKSLAPNGMRFMLALSLTLICPRHSHIHRRRSTRTGRPTCGCHSATASHFIRLKFGLPLLNLGMLGGCRFLQLVDSLRLGHLDPI